MEHDELVKEMKQVEKMTTSERLKYARKKRLSQLKKHTAYDKQHDKKVGTAWFDVRQFVNLICVYLAFI